MDFLGGSSQLHRIRLRGVVTASALTVGLLALSSGAAFAGPSSFTWSGAGGDNSWSDGANWSGTAPQPKSSVDLAFPVLPCGSGCDSTSTNDLTGVKVPSLSVALGIETGSGDYNISGNGIKVGSLDVTSSVPNGDGEQGAYLGLPMTLLGSETWSVDLENNSNFNLGTVVGANSDSLTVGLPVATPGNGGGFLDFPSVNTGPLTFQGSTTGPASTVTGGDFNGTSKESVKLADAGLFVFGQFGATTKKEATTDFGPLTAKGANIQFGNGSSGPYGINTVEGDASLNSATHLTFNSLDPGTGTKPSPGLSYPQLNASGTVKLGSADLGIFADCSQTIGTKYTIVTGSTIKGTFSGLPNDTVLQAGDDGSSTCDGGSAPGAYFEIAYSSTAVTATVVSPPPSAPVVHVPATSYPIAHELSNGTFGVEG